MSGLEVIRREFNGAQCEVLRKEDGSLWMTSHQVGRAVGYDDPAKQIRKVYRRHLEELRPFRGETSGASLGRTVATAPLTIWRKEALILFACFARTESAKMFRAWILQLCRELEDGDKVLVDREHFERLTEGPASGGLGLLLAELEAAKELKKGLAAVQGNEFLERVFAVRVLRTLGVTPEEIGAPRASDFADRVEALEESRRALAVARQRPDEVSAALVARRFGWLSESGRPHYQAVVAAAKKAGLGEGLTREVTVEIGDGKWGPRFVFSPEGVNAFAVVDAEHGSKDSFRFTYGVKEFSVFRDPSAPAPAEAACG